MGIDLSVHVCGCMYVLCASVCDHVCVCAYVWCVCDIGTSSTLQFIS